MFLQVVKNRRSRLLKNDRNRFRVCRSIYSVSCYNTSRLQRALIEI